MAGILIVVPQTSLRLRSVKVSHRAEPPAYSEVNMSIEIKSIYFEKPGPKNTHDVLEIVRQRAEQVGIKTIVIASSTGKTAVRATEILKGVQIVAVSLSTGFT